MKTRRFALKSGSSVDSFNLRHSTMGSEEGKSIAIIKEDEQEGSHRSSKE